jgi:hypothetical protein
VSCRRGARWRRREPATTALRTACQSLVDAARHTPRAGQLNAAACIRTWSGHAPGAPARAPARVSIHKLLHHQLHARSLLRRPTPHSCLRVPTHYTAPCRSCTSSAVFTPLRHAPRFAGRSVPPRCSSARPDMASYPEPLAAHSALRALATRRWHSALKRVWLHIGAPPPPPPPLRVPTAHPPEKQELS